MREKLKQARRSWRYWSAVAAYRSSGIEAVCERLARIHDSKLTARLLRRFHAVVGEHVYFKGGLTVDNASRDQDSTGDFRHLVIGKNVYIGKNVFLDLPNKIVLGDESILSAGVTILTHSDCGRRYMSRYFPRKTAPVEIGAGAWIGANVTILCGVRIGRGAVVAASALVTSDVPDGEVYGEVPARHLRKVEVSA